MLLWQHALLWDCKKNIVAPRIMFALMDSSRFPATFALYRWRTCLYIASAMTSTAPAQMHAKHTACALVNGSPSTRTPERRLIVGLMYWMNPISESGVLFAAVANRMSGTAVIGPVSTKRTRVCHASSDMSGEKNTL